MWMLHKYSIYNYVYVYVKQFCGFELLMLEEKKLVMLPDGDFQYYRWFQKLVSRLVSKHWNFSNMLMIIITFIPKVLLHEC